MKRLLLEVTIILIVGAGLIFHQYNRLPYNLDFDEVDFGKLALSLDGKSYTPYSPSATGHATLYFYVILLFFKIFGVTNFALRLPAAIFGVCNVLVFYLIIRLIVKNYALTFTLIFATLRWHFSFARFSFEATFLLFLELISLYFLLHCFKNKRARDVFFTALFAGLAFNSYTPGRIFFIIPLVFLGFSFLKKQITIHRLAIFLCAFILVILPLFSYLLAHPDPRFDQQFFFKNPRLSTGERIRFLKDSLVSTALMFHLKGDMNGRHNYPGKPAINPLLGLFFIIGLGLAAKNYRNFYHQVFFLYLLISLLPTILTYPHENPHMLRTFTVIPSVVYFTLLTVESLLNSFAKFRAQKYVMFIVYYLLFLSSLYEIRTYFLYQKYVTSEAFEVYGDIKTLIKKGYSRPAGKRL